MLTVAEHDWFAPDGIGHSYYILKGMGFIRPYTFAPTCPTRMTWRSIHTYFILINLMSFQMYISKALYFHIKKFFFNENFVLVRYFKIFWQLLKFYFLTLFSWTKSLLYFKIHDLISTCYLRHKTWRNKFRKRIKKIASNTLSTLRTIYLKIKGW